MRSQPQQCKKRAFVPRCDIDHERGSPLVTRRSFSGNNRDRSGLYVGQTVSRGRVVGAGSDAREAVRTLASREILYGHRSLIGRALSAERRKPKSKKAPRPGGAFLSCFQFQSQRSGLNRRPLDYESSALPLSYAGNSTKVLALGPATPTRCLTTCPGTDSNRDALRHHPLKMACLPISPPGPCSVLQSAISSELLENRNDASPSDLTLLFTGNCPTRERRGSNPRPLE